MEVVFQNHPLHTFIPKDGLSVAEIQVLINQDLGLTSDQFYLIYNGRKVKGNDTLCGKIHIVPRILGGKGGFGSMLRAIGAQIEKTTNREACRDLSGRRLRDINEEQRLKKWVAQQAEREKEAKERKKKKLEKLLEQPRHEFKDEEYDKERSSLPEKVEDAVLKGLEASCSSTKRKPNEDKSKIPKKKPKLWLDSQLDEEILSSESDSEDEKQPLPSTSQSCPDTKSASSGEDPTQTKSNDDLKSEGKSVGVTIDCVEQTDNENIEETEPNTGNVAKQKSHEDNVTDQV